MLARKIHCIVRENQPSKNTTIIEDADLKNVLKNIENVVVYWRHPKDCPFARGNWIIDLTLISTEIICIKLPKEMKQEDVMAYCQPLIDYLTIKLEKKLYTEH